MCEERTKTRCVHCELVQWADRANCRRCGQFLPAPVVNIIERVVENVVHQQDHQCVQSLQEACKLISATVARLQESSASEKISMPFNSLPAVEPFPKLDEVERAMIVAAYRRSNGRPAEAARLLGIGKTTFYRKLRGLRELA